MKKLLFATCLLFLSSILYNCSKNQTATKTPIETEIYPNQDSELALLMRAMDSDSQKLKNAILNKQSLEDFREKFAKIHTAIPTDANTKSKAFEAMSNSFLASLDKVYTQENKVETFNLMVNNCLNCHKTTCPGPTVRIKKLLIE